MSAVPARPGRLTVAAAVLVTGAVLVGLDLAARPIDPFASPPPVALGSGLAASAAHCAMVD